MSNLHASAQVDYQGPVLKQAEGLLAALRWKIKGEWQPTEDGYTVCVERAQSRHQAEQHGVVSRVKR